MAKKVKIKLMDGRLAHTFLFVVLLALLGATAWIVRPFIIEIVLAGTLASFFYPVYKNILKVIKSPAISSLVTTLMIAGLIFVPLVNFGIFFVSKFIAAYNESAPYLTSQEFMNQVNSVIGKALALFQIDVFTLSDLIRQGLGLINTTLLKLSSLIVGGTTSFLLGSVIIFLTIFYLFIDGKNLMRKVMSLTPLPNKYDQQIFTAFREVSFSSIISTFITAIFQGLLGGIGFLIVGLPAFFPGVLMGVSSILPYVGAAAIWIPAVIYLFVSKMILKGIILLIVGVLISSGDNILRAYIIKGKTQVHEMIIFFSLIGGLAAFGFWGIIIGPLVVSMLLTVLDIYEREFTPVLEKSQE